MANTNPNPVPTGGTPQPPPNPVPSAVPSVSPAPAGTRPNRPPRSRRPATASSGAGVPPSGGAPSAPPPSARTSMRPSRMFPKWLTVLVGAVTIILVIGLLSALGVWGFRWMKGMIGGTDASVSLVASVPHGKFTIIYDGNEVMEPVTFSTSFELYELVGKAAAAAPTNQTVFLSIKGQTRQQSVSKSFENRAALMDFVAKWGEEVYPPTITPVPSVPVTPRSSSTKTNTVLSAADTAYVEAAIDRMRRQKAKEVSALLVSGSPQRVSGLPAMSRPSGRIVSEPQSEQWVQVSTGTTPVFNSLQPPAFDRPSSKKTCFGRWWDRVSGPSTGYAMVTYYPRAVSWSHRQAYPAPMYASGGIFQPTPVMIGRSW